LLVAGYLASFLFHSTGGNINIEDLTLWGWLRGSAQRDLEPTLANGA
jgi:hypothetical protein